MRLPRATVPGADRDDALASVAERAVASAVRLGLDPRTVTRLLELEPPRRGAEPFDGPSAIGAFFERSLATGVDAPRKSTGTFYTPPALARALVRRTLRGAADGGTVLDPSAGAGAFLLAVLEACAGRSPGRVLERLYAIELDPVAARLCRLALWLACADDDLEVERLERQVQVADTLRTLADPSSPLAAAWPEIGASGGFDTVVGNPPWDVVKPDSRAFFGRFEPTLRGLDKQAALHRQRELCAEDPSIAAAWAREVERHAEFTRFCRMRFRLRGRSGDPNLYKLFVEASLDALREGGRLGMLVPCGLHSDLGAQELRRALLDEHRWLVLCGFENRTRLFPDVDGRFKFDAIVVQKSGRTSEVSTAFMETEPDALAKPAEPLLIGRNAIRRLSPASLVVPEVRSRDDLELLDRIHSGAVSFGDRGPNGWRLSFRRELDMTLHSDRFVTRDRLETKGLVSDEHGRWLEVARVRSGADAHDPACIPLCGGGHVRRDDVREVFVPLWEGRMVEAFDPSAKGWMSGRARRALWSTPMHASGIAPQYLVRAEELARVDPSPASPKVGFLAVGSATNTRTMLAAALLRAPCGNAVPVLRSRRGEDWTLALCAVLCSLTYDHALRTRLAGTNLNRFALDETPLPRPELLLGLRILHGWVAALCWTHARFAEGARFVEAAAWPRSRLEARVALEAVVAQAFGLDADDLVRIAADCWRPTGELRDRAAARRFDPKGLWRVDRDRPPEHRLPVLAVAARRALDRVLREHGGDRERGVSAFLTDFALPESVDLSALGFEGAPAGERAVASGATDVVAPPRWWAYRAAEAARAAAFDPA